MKIKRKVEKNLPQLIEWAWDNPKSSRNKRFVSENKEFPYVNQYVIFNEVGYAEIENSYCYGRNDLFTVEVEEEITEDTEFKSMVEVTTDDLFAVWEQASISTWESEHSKEFHAYIDGEFKLIWRDGKLVE